MGKVIDFCTLKFPPIPSGMGRGVEEGEGECDSDQNQMGGFRHNVTMYTDIAGRVPSKPAEARLWMAPLKHAASSPPVTTM